MLPFNISIIIIPKSFSIKTSDLTSRYKCSYKWQKQVSGPVQYNKNRGYTDTHFTAGFRFSTLTPEPKLGFCLYFRSMLHLHFSINCFHIRQLPADTSLTSTMDGHIHCAVASLWHLLSQREKVYDSPSHLVGWVFSRQKCARKCQILLILFWKAGICGRNPTLCWWRMKKRGEKMKERGESAPRSDVAAREAPPRGRHQNLPLLKPLSPRATGDHSPPEDEQRWQRWRQGENIDG